VIAGSEVLDARAGFHDLARAFVADRHRQRPRAVAVDHREIRMAQTGGPHANEHFARSGGIQVDLGDLQGETLRVRPR
jgi:hypothetical protein